MSHASIIAGVTVAILASYSDCNAAWMTQPGASVGGENVNATADFSLVGNTLTITLTNLGGLPGNQTLSPAAILTGIDFNIAGSPIFGPGGAFAPTAALGVGSSLFLTHDPQTQDFAADLNGGYVMDQGADIGNGFQYGISSVGANGVFPAGVLTKGNGGNDYGIVGGGTTNMNLDDAPLSSHIPLVRNSVIFTLIANSAFSLSDITDVSFHFGSAGVLVDGTNPEFGPGVPEPASLALLALGSVGLGGFGLRRRKVNAA